MALVSDLTMSVGDKGSIRKINQHLLGTWWWVLGLGFLKIEKINTLLKPPYEVISSLSMKEELRLEMVSCSVQDHIVSKSKRVSGPKGGFKVHAITVCAASYY